MLLSKLQKIPVRYFDGFFNVFSMPLEELSWVLSWRHTWLLITRDDNSSSIKQNETIIESYLYAGSGLCKECDYGPWACLAQLPKQPWGLQWFPSPEEAEQAPVECRGLSSLAAGCKSTPHFSLNALLPEYGLMYASHRKVFLYFLTIRAIHAAHMKSPDSKFFWALLRSDLPT